MMSLRWFYNIPEHFKGNDKTKVNMEVASEMQELVIDGQI